MHFRALAAVLVLAAAARCGVSAPEANVTITSSDPSVMYNSVTSGHWAANDFNANACGAPSEHFTLTSNDTVTFSFNGTAVYWFATVTRLTGRATATLDGVALPTILPPSPVPSQGVCAILVQQTDLEPGPHILEVRNVDNALLAVDAFIVTELGANTNNTSGASTPSPTPTMMTPAAATSNSKSNTDTIPLWAIWLVLGVGLAMLLVAGIWGFDRRKHRIIAASAAASAPRP